MFLRILLVLDVAGTCFGADPAYRSPYHVEYTFSETELTADLQQGARADWKQESTLPFAEWYASGAHRLGSWGPSARQYPAPQGITGRSAQWMRERVIATALRFTGYSYAHHHIPDWEPPANWPGDGKEKTVAGKGLDCSNFTAFAYNLGLGIKPSGGIEEQSAMTTAVGPGAGHSMPVQWIALPPDYADFSRDLRTGDLLFIKSRQGNVSHVVLWVGGIGKSPDGTPLILDCTGDGHHDSAGQTIPSGVNLRPFRKGNWYAASADHALRIIPDGK